MSDSTYWTNNPSGRWTLVVKFGNQNSFQVDWILQLQVRYSNPCWGTKDWTWCNLENKKTAKRNVMKQAPKISEYNKRIFFLLPPAHKYHCNQTTDFEALCTEIFIFSSSWFVPCITRQFQWKVNRKWLWEKSLFHGMFLCKRKPYIVTSGKRIYH